MDSSKYVNFFYKSLNNDQHFIYLSCHILLQRPFHLINLITFSSAPFNVDFSKILLFAVQLYWKSMIRNGLKPGSGSLECMNQTLYG